MATPFFNSFFLMAVNMMLFMAMRNKISMTNTPMIYVLITMF